RSQLWLRPLDAAAARPLRGTDGAYSVPFWSPDGGTIAFFARGKLKRVAVTGGPAQDGCDVAALVWSGTLNARSDIPFFSPGDILFSGQGGIYRVSAAGGQATAITKTDVSQEREHLFPRFLPDGRRFVYETIQGAQPSGVAVGSIDAAPTERTRLMHESSRLEF